MWIRTDRPPPKPLPRGGRDLKDNTIKSPSLLGEGDIGDEVDNSGKGLGKG